MASDGMKEGTRRIAKAIGVLAWLWLALFLSLSAVSAWGQQLPMAAPAQTAPQPSVDPQIDPSKVQWDEPGKAAPPSAARHAPKSQTPGLPPDASAASGDDPFSRYMAKASEQEKAPPPPPSRDYVAAVLLALAGVVGFAILRTLAWILAGFAK